MAPSLVALREEAGVPIWATWRLPLPLLPAVGSRGHHPRAVPVHVLDQRAEGPEDLRSPKDWPLLLREEGGRVLRPEPEPPPDDSTQNSRELHLIPFLLGHPAALPAPGSHTSSWVPPHHWRSSGIFAAPAAVSPNDITFLVGTTQTVMMILRGGPSDQELDPLTTALLLERSGEEI